MSTFPDSTIPSVDLVIAIDTSTSMRDEAVGLSESAEAAIEAARSSCPSDLQVTWLGVEGRWNNTNFDRTVRDYLIQESKIDEAQIRGRKRGTVAGGGAQEDGARTIEDIATHFNWRPGASRAIFYLSDEGLEGGGSDVTQEDIKAANRAIETAKEAKTTVHTYFGTTRSRNKEKLQQEFARVAHETSGQAFTEQDSIEGFATVLEKVICATRNQVDETATPTSTAPERAMAAAPDSATTGAAAGSAAAFSATSGSATAGESATARVVTADSAEPLVAAPDAISAHQPTNRIVRNHSLASAGVGLLPLPLLDIAAIGTIQLLMIRKLSKFYGQPFSPHRTKAFIAALIGGGQTGLIMTSVAQLLPGIGLMGFTLTTAVTGGAVTYDIGMVFVRHFEMGGTFLNLDANAMRNYFAEQCKQGKLVVSKAQA